ncbi:MAG: DUF3127 domain-containing protein [Bacteroidetes bacterium CHB5]|nr:DUF3127 domain-containing protein [Bacteroidetes bacterium CHB5]
MDISGVVVALLPLQSGQGKSGKAWKKQEFILEIPGQFPRKVCLSLWGEKVDENRVTIGEKITASINLESREYNNRWYTEARVWKITRSGNAGSNEAPPPTDDFIPESGGSDDLPF